MVLQYRLYDNETIAILVLSHIAQVQLYDCGEDNPITT